MPINTPCRDCVFSVWQKNKQTGCSLNRLDKFRAANIDVAEVYDENNKEFYVINGEFCFFCRDQNWGKQFKKEYWSQLVEFETQVQYNVIFLARQSTLEHVGEVLESIDKQEIKPKHVTVIIDNLKPPKVGRLLEKYNWKWRIQHTSEEVTDLQATDLVEDVIKFPFYVVTSNNIDISFSSTFNSKVRDEFKKFGMIKNWMGTKQIVSRAIHKNYCGNAEFSLEDKLTQDGFQDKIYDGAF